MNIDKIKEETLVNDALEGKTDNLIAYIESDIEALAKKFSLTKRGVELEIPITSLKKAAEAHINDAVIKYKDLMNMNSEILDNGFAKFYIWFAEQGINEYAHKWEFLLSGAGHSGPCCH